MSGDFYKPGETGVWNVMGCVARLASVIVMLTSFLGLFINPIKTITRLFMQLDVAIWHAVLLEIVLFCFFAISPSLDECARSVSRPTTVYRSRKLKILSFIETIILFSIYLLSMVIVI